MNDADRLDLPTIGPEGLDETWDAISYEIMGQRVYSYYDRSGNPISMRDWCRLRAYSEVQDNHDYVRVAQDTVGDYWISTVWLGLDHGVGSRLIFETMVFQQTGAELDSDLDMERYSTEEEALAGHRAMVEKVSLFVGLDPEAVTRESQ